MRRLLRYAVRAISALALVLLVAVAGRLGYNLAHAHANGAVPLRSLAEGAVPAPVREAARGTLARLGSDPDFARYDWVAVVDTTARDSVILGLYRAEDARLMRRMLMPEPYVSGVARYAVSSGRLVYAGVGVR